MDGQRKVYVPLKAYLKERLTELKGERTYNELIEDLLKAGKENLSRDERKALEKLTGFKRALEKALGKEFTLEESVALLVNSLIDYGDCLDEKEALERKLKKAREDEEKIEEKLKKLAGYVGELYPPNGVEGVLERVVLIPQDVYRQLVSLAKEKRTAVEPFVANAVRGALVSYILSTKIG